MGVNYWGIFFFVIPIIAAVLLGSITLMLVVVKDVKKKFKYKED